jgi:hypothetical protein
MTIMAKDSSATVRNETPHANHNNGIDTKQGSRLDERAVLEERTALDQDTFLNQPTQGSRTVNGRRNNESIDSRSPVNQRDSSLLNNTSTDSDTDIKQRAQALIDDSGLDYQTRAVLRYALRTADPLLPELVRAVEQGETLGSKPTQRQSSADDDLTQRQDSRGDKLTTTRRSRNSSIEPESVEGRADAIGLVKDYSVEYELEEDQADSGVRMNGRRDLEFRDGAVDEDEDHLAEGGSRKDRHGPVEYHSNRCDSFSLREHELRAGRSNEDRPDEDPFDEDGAILDEDEAIDAKVDELTSLICRPGNEPDIKSAALLILMSTLEHSPHPKYLAGAAKHLAFLHCCELNLYGVVDSQIADVERRLLATESVI